MAILVTGGTGYIGSHTCVELLEKGEEVIIIDNLSNSKIETVDAIETITGKRPKFYKGDILDADILSKIFEENPDITAVIHFAGLKAVGESVQKPLEYYYNNVSGTLVLLQVMRKYKCKKIVFSSSATVYGDPGTPKYVETMGRGKTVNPYGTSKAMIEQILEDTYKVDKEWQIALLRYFNPIGAHESGLIGDNPNGIPNNLMPYIQKVAAGELDHLNVFGNDYPTIDGTGVRDYIHVVDLAKGHILALQIGKGVSVYNLGTGKGSSVLEIVHTFEEVNQIQVPYVIAPRREGDLPEFYADPTKIEKELGWKSIKNLQDMCRDSWKFAKNQAKI